MSKGPKGEKRPADLTGTAIEPAKNPAAAELGRKSDQARAIDRKENLSQSMERIWTRFSRGNLFMPLVYELSCLSSSIKYHIKAHLRGF